jgi:hypothetical protein
MLPYKEYDLGLKLQNELHHTFYHTPYKFSYLPLFSPLPWQSMLYVYIFIKPLFWIIVYKTKTINSDFMAFNVPAVYEMCLSAHFTYIHSLPSGVISLPYNELALPVQQIYATTNLRDCGCDCNIRKRGLYEGKGYFFSVPTEIEVGKSGILLPVL